ncbi:hypothetical protein ACFWIO_02290 [Streptomyces diastatochromogenes]|uniref:hypothetical protein n=1 Tax=Streptomyces diastatochromogenes TaxID=42236 RepID=UPI00364DC86C
MGFADCHGRPRTEAMLDGLEVVPRARCAVVAHAVRRETDAVICRLRFRLP